MEMEETMKDAITEFYVAITSALHNRTLHSRLPEEQYEEVFIHFFKCLTVSLGLDFVKCARTVDGKKMQKATLTIKLKDQQDMLLEVRSKPDMFLYHRVGLWPGNSRSVFALIEAKGTHYGAVIESDDELDEDADSDTKCMHHLSLAPKKIGPKNWLPSARGTTQRSVRAKKKMAPKSKSTLPTLDEGSDDDNDENEIEDLKMLKNAPAWLKRISPEMHATVKKFLPQLVGEMWCCARSNNIELKKTLTGLHVGIGVVGFDIYFVTMKDASYDGEEKYEDDDDDDDDEDDGEEKYEDVVKTDSAYTNVFVTRPLNLLARNDRRIIMKILTALLFLVPN